MKQQDHHESAVLAAPRSVPRRRHRRRQQASAMVTLMRLGWGQEDPVFRQLFTSHFIPGGTKQQAAWFNELQRISSSPADAV
jgi:hypothetical protein